MCQDIDCLSVTILKIFFSELPYKPIITGIALNSDSNRAVDVRFIAGFDGNSPITKYIVQYRLVTDSKFHVNTVKDAQLQKWILNFQIVFSY